MGNWKEKAAKWFQHLGYDLYIGAKWCSLACVVGFGIGMAGILFHWAIDWATQTRTVCPQLLFFLPVAGCSIVWLYHRCGIRDDKGTNLVLDAVRGRTPLSFRTAPLIFAASTLTHLCGGSSGREGAALQLGGSLASSLGHRFPFSQGDQRILVVSGMAAAFSALFGTPITAAVFALEVAQVGIMQYSALLPAFFSSLIASLLAGWMGLKPTAYTVAQIPALSMIALFQTAILALLCALVAILFCASMHIAHRLYQRFFPNPYIRAAVGGILVLVLTWLVGCHDYNGAGGEIITAAVQGHAVPYAFLLKILFTSLTLGAGFKGGEIVPSFFTGATFGCVVGPLIGLPASFSAAVGITAVFCGVTNCPLASLFLALELFGQEGIGLYAAVCGVSYLMSGYDGLYGAQEILYSKEKIESRSPETETNGSVAECAVSAEKEGEIHTKSEVLQNDRE